MHEMISDMFYLPGCKRIQGQYVAMLQVSNKLFLNLFKKLKNMHITIIDHFLLGSQSQGMGTGIFLQQE